MKITIMCITALCAILLSIFFIYVISSPQWRSVAWTNRNPSGLYSVNYINELYHAIFGKYYGYEYVNDDKEMQDKAINLRDNVLFRYGVKAKMWEVGTGAFSGEKIDPRIMELEVIIQTDEDKMISCVYDKTGKFIKRKQ